MSLTRKEFVQSKLIDRELVRGEFDHDQERSPNKIVKEDFYKEHFVLSSFRYVIPHAKYFTSFEEEFWDTPKMTLLSNSCWLRCRGDEWTYKENVSNENNVLGFQEYQSKEEDERKYILKELRVDKLEDIRKSYTAFAKFRTRRYRLPSETSHSVWIDVTYFDEPVKKFYVIGTIQRPLLNPENQDILLADQRVRCRYGFRSPAPSKIIAYLHASRSHYLDSIKKKVADPSPSSFFDYDIFSLDVHINNDQAVLAFRPVWEQELKAYRKLLEQLIKMEDIPVEKKRRYLYYCAQERKLPPDSSMDTLREELSKFGNNGEEQKLWNILQDIIIPEQRYRRFVLRVVDTFITRCEFPPTLDKFLEAVKLFVDLGIKKVEPTEYNYVMEQLISVTHRLEEKKEIVFLDPLPNNT